MSLVESVARERGYEGDADDGVLIDFRVGVARQALRDAVSNLEGMLTCLNARPGTGINFALIFEIADAERRVADATATLREVARSEP